jgi:hypothetical protein
MKRRWRPQPPDQLFPGDHFSRLLQERCEHLKRLLLKLEPKALFAKFAASRFDLEDAEPDSFRRGLGRSHSRLVRPECTTRLLVAAGAT